MTSESPILKFVSLYNYSQKSTDLFLVKLAPIIWAICRKEVCWIKMCSWHDLHTAMLWEKCSRKCKALWFSRFQIRLYCSKTCWTVIAMFLCCLLFQTETKLVRYSTHVIFSFSEKNLLLDSSHVQALYQDNVQVCAIFFALLLSEWRSPCKGDSGV